MPTTYAIPNGATAMLPVLWTGNGASSRSFTGWGFAPDFIWMKSRTSAANHALIDSVRGTGAKVLESDLTSAENSDGLSVTSFDSNGFTGATGSVNFSYANSNTQSYVGWGWKAGGAAVSNTSGSITSSVSANTTAGFSVVTFTNPSSGSGSIGHGLGVKPAMIIVKARSNTSNWTTAHQSLGAMASTWVNLDTAGAVQTSSNIWGGEPTSTVFYCGTGIQVASATMVAYCWAAVPGYSAFGSYVGNGSTDGPFIYTGFKPAFILTKDITTGSFWWEMVDSARSPSNVVDRTLYANVSDAEYNNSSYNKDFLSNGFKIRNTNGGDNTSGSTYIYAAFASNPFKYANAR